VVVRRQLGVIRSVSAHCVSLPGILLVVCSDRRLATTGHVISAAVTGDQAWRARCDVGRGFIVGAVRLAWVRRTTWLRATVGSVFIVLAIGGVPDDRAFVAEDVCVAAARADSRRMTLHAVRRNMRLRRRPNPAAQAQAGFVQTLSRDV
jgi:hypothetical protein